jgi:hypothetical protein
MVRCKWWRSALGAASNGNQHGLHQPTAAVVVIGVGGEPERQAECGKHPDEQQKFGHGIA